MIARANDLTNLSCHGHVMSFALGHALSLDGLWNYVSDRAHFSMNLGDRHDQNPDLYVYRYNGDLCHGRLHEASPSRVHDLNLFLDGTTWRVKR